MISGILNRQERRTAYGHRFTAHLVSSLRRNWDIPRFEPPAVAPQGELMNIKQIAAALGVATSTVHRWLNQGIIAGEQLTPGAPWRIRLTNDLRARVAEEAQLPHHVSNHASVGSFSTNSVATCQARRDQSSSCQAWTQKRLAPQGHPLSIRPLRSNCTSWGVV